MAERYSQIPGTELRPFRLCLGGNVFGWTVDRAGSFSVLDRYAEAGGNFVDTADSYSAWVPGNHGGESETIIGEWMRSRGNRDDVIVATKVGSFPELRGLRAETIRAAAEASLRRLGTDHIDLYYAHRDDPSTPVEEALEAFTALAAEGKVRAVGASNFSAARLFDAAAAARAGGWLPYRVVQPGYNLMDRAEYELELAPLCAKEGIGCVPYYGLARGFLTGKYRPGAALPDSPRAAGAAAYLDERGGRVLAALDRASAATGVSPAAVALAWLGAQPGIVAPIASARSPEQLEELLGSVGLDLDAGIRSDLDAASGNAHPGETERV